MYIEVLPVTEERRSVGVMVPVTVLDCVEDGKGREGTPKVQVVIFVSVIRMSLMR